MDKSKLPDITKKSTETPWSGKHEQSRLSGKKSKSNPRKSFWQLLDTMRIKKGF
jgi:hypothetical protein